MKRTRRRLGLLAAAAIGAACLIPPQQAQATFGLTFGGRRAGVTVWSGPPVVRHYGYYPYSSYYYAPTYRYYGAYADPYWRGYRSAYPYRSYYYRGPVWHQPRHYYHRRWR